MSVVLNWVEVSGRKGVVTVVFGRKKLKTVLELRLECPLKFGGEYSQCAKFIIFISSHGIAECGIMNFIIRLDIRTCDCFEFLRAF